MRQIIGRKVYNTETAELLASRGNEHGSNDFRCVQESLYRSKKGAYFSGSGGIKPLSEREAIEWLEEHDTSALERLFPELIEEA